MSMADSFTFSSLAQIDHDYSNILIPDDDAGIALREILELLFTFCPSEGYLPTYV